MANQIISVPFHGNNLFVIECDGQPYTPMKAIAEGMGLSWQGQHEKLSANRERFCIKEIVMQMPGDDQQRAVSCLPLRKLPGWLMTIHPNKIKNLETREKVIMYQNEADDALWDYWTKGEAINPRMPYVQNPGDTLTVDQAGLLRNMLTKAAEKLPKEKQGAIIMRGWSKLKAHFKVGYRQIPQAEFTEAVSILARHISEGEYLPLPDETSDRKDRRAWELSRRYYVAVRAEMDDCHLIKSGKIEIERWTMPSIADTASSVLSGVEILSKTCEMYIGKIRKDARFLVELNAG